MQQDILLYTNTNDFRHDVTSFAAGKVTSFFEQLKWNVLHTEDSTVFHQDSLNKFTAIVFLLTSGDVLDSTGRECLAQYVEDGGGLITVHTGTFTEPGWNWWQEKIGARFTGHPPGDSAKLLIENRSHPATRHIDDNIWMICDEIYSFDRNPRHKVSVLVSVDESSYNVDNNEWFPEVNLRMGDHPLVWCCNAGRGRIFQTALGHGENMYNDPVFMEHLKGAVLWASGI